MKRKAPNSGFNTRSTRRFVIKKSSFLLIIWISTVFSISLVPASSDSGPATHRVNSPYWTAGKPEPSRSIAWFGKVDSSNNYADLRTIYTDELFWITIHIIDRLLRFDTTPAQSDLTDYDAISVYIDLDGNTGNSLDGNSFRFDLQLNGYHLGYRWKGLSWDNPDVPFSIISGWRGDGGMNDDYWDKGWVGDFKIPFSSLGLSGPPATNTIWGFAVVVHDRDEPGITIPDQSWPKDFNPNIPASWGQLNFGIPSYNPPLSLFDHEYTIRQGLNGVSVTDAHVGGHFNCGDPYGPTYYTGWGSANYAGSEQFNIQNQWDVADWPCFSKFFITFPIDTVPVGEFVLSATLSMTLFGNSGGGPWGEPPDSYIQVLNVGQDWNENTLTWNNAPLAIENISGALVKPRDYSRPEQTYYWDVSRAFLQAYTASEPLRLALYSADGPMHTGKYFWSSNVGNWNAQARPTLRVVTGTPCTTPGIVCRFNFLPLAQK